MPTICDHGERPGDCSSCGVVPSLAREPDILARFDADIERAGLVGESKVARIIFLAIVSRLLDQIVSIAIKGTSSAGKSYAIKRALAFFPPSAYWELSAMSERALAYSREPLKHRMLVLFEAAGMAGDLQTYLLRSLLSEGRVRYETVEKTKNGLEAKLIDREGPTGLIVTTTEVRLHPENETRLFSVVANDTVEQTRRVLRQLAQDGGSGDVDYEGWHALQEWLAKGPTDVVIPYAEALAHLVQPVAVRLRRDFGSVLALIRAHALLHRATRALDMHGRVVANITDYAVVRGLVADLVAEGVEATVSDTVRQTVQAVGELATDGKTVTSAEVARRLKLDSGATLRRVKAAISRGYVLNDEDRRGRPARLRLGEPLPDQVDVLPTVEVLGEGDCTVAVASGGIEKQEPDSTDVEPILQYPSKPANNPATAPVRFLLDGKGPI